MLRGDKTPEGAIFSRHGRIETTAEEVLMALHERSARLTYDDYILFPEDGRRHEILDGGHQVSPAPYLRHQEILLRLAVALGSFLDRFPRGSLFPAPVDVLLSRHDIVQPDLVYVAQERRHLLTDRNIQGAPDLVVEVLSPGTRSNDEGLKRDTYEHFGVQEYWLVDPARRSVAVDRLIDGRFQRAAELKAEAGDTLTTPLLPGFEIPLAALFA
jgi:Uma2 family endonuclease